MRVKSNCRWHSGKCTIDNNDFSVDIVGNYLNSRDLEIVLTSNVALNGAKISFNRDEAIPSSMIRDNQDALVYRLMLNTLEHTDNINLVLSLQKSVFFAQIPTIFFQKVEQVDY